tara:strand:- start:494 stop:673 length:180 start_codon:yes stop_codon:yes gene_type:complete
MESSRAIFRADSIGTIPFFVPSDKINITSSAEIALFIGLDFLFDVTMIQLTYKVGLNID